MWGFVGGFFADKAPETPADIECVDVGKCSKEEEKTRTQRRNQRSRKAVKISKTGRCYTSMKNVGIDIGVTK